MPLPPASELIVIDSGVPRTLAGQQVQRTPRRVRGGGAQAGRAALRDVTDPAAVEQLPPCCASARATWCSENLRVLAACKGVDAERFGELMNASHASLRDDYEVSIR